MATFTTALAFGGGLQRGDMKEVIADQNYYFDAEGNVTTDESKGERWLAKEGANVLEEHREALDAFQNPAGDSKVAQAEEAEEGAEPAKAPKANKKAAPSKNKGVK